MTFFNYMNKLLNIWTFSIHSRMAGGNSKDEGSGLKKGSR